jgi:hypothetical protein
MDFLEKDLEEIIFNASSEQLLYKGLDVVGHRKRQLRIGNYGIADMVTFDRQEIWCEKDRIINITVYELKKDKVGISAFLQAIKYVRGIKTYIENHRRKNIRISFNIVLIGRTLDTEGSLCFLPDLIDWDTFTCGGLGKLDKVSYYTYSYGIDGITFKSHNNYDLVNSGF